MGYFEATVPDAAAFKSQSAFFLSPTTISIMFLLWGLVALSWLHIMAKEEAKRGPYTGRTLYLLVGGVLLVLGVATVVKPVSTIDLYLYIVYGRQIVVHHQSPYISTPADSLPDPFADQLSRTWFDVTSAYGPVALALFSLVAWMPWPTLWSAMVGMKALMTASTLGLAPILFSRLRGEPARMAKTLAIVANPLVVWLYVVDAHLDILSLLLLLLAVESARRERPGWSAVATALACGVKLPFVIVVPVLFCWLFRKSQRYSTVYLATFSLLYGGMVAFSGGGDFAVTVVQDDFGLGLANLVPRFFWFFDWSPRDIRLGSDLVFVLFGAGLCYLLLAGKFSNDPMFPTALTCTVFVLTRTFWQSWYSVWFWPLLALSTRRSHVYIQVIALWTICIPLYTSRLIFMRDILAAMVILASVALVVIDRRRGD